MVRGISAQTSQTAAVDKGTIKKRHRTKVPLKPKAAFTFENDRKPSQAVEPLMVKSRTFTSIPRAMRTRIEKAIIPQIRKQPAVEADVLAREQPGHQPLARNSSGKVALGPWNGPFGSGSASDDDAPVLYLDRSGSAHLSLNCPDDAVMVDAAPLENSARCATAPAQKQAMQLTEGRASGSLKIQEKEMLVLQSKPHRKGNACHRNVGKRGHVKNRVVGMINQPRKN